MLQAHYASLWMPLKWDEKQGLTLPFRIIILIRTDGGNKLCIFPCHCLLLLLAKHRCKTNIISLNLKNVRRLSTKWVSEGYIHHNKQQQFLSESSLQRFYNALILSNENHLVIRASFVFNALWYQSAFPKNKIYIKKKVKNTKVLLRKKNST